MPTSQLEVLMDFFYVSHQVRKTILEMIHRLPVSEIVRPHVNSILILTLNLIREDNEENVLICLRIIIDLHKQYRPAYYPQVDYYLDAILEEALIIYFLD